MQKKDIFIFTCCCIHFRMMTTGAKYRVTGDIILRTKASTKGVDRDRRVDVYYGNTKTNFDDVAIVQRRRPLTPTTPYFVVEVQKCGKAIRDNHYMM